VRPSEAHAGRVGSRVIRTPASAAARAVTIPRSVMRARLTERVAAIGVSAAFEVEDTRNAVEPRRASVSNGVSNPGQDRRWLRPNQLESQSAGRVPIHASSTPAGHHSTDAWFACTRSSRLLVVLAVSMIEPQVPKPWTTRPARWVGVHPVTDGRRCASLVPTRSHPAVPSGRSPAGIWLTRAPSSARPRGFEPLTFGSVGRGSEA
jgi:hypothetical protein